MYIQENQGSIDARKACKLLGVSRFGNYAHINRSKFPHAIENEVLQEEIRVIFEENKGRYGSGRISKDLAERGIMCSRKRAAKLMRVCGLYPKGFPENIGVNTVIKKKLVLIY